jgi:hypothetical protein
VSGRGGEPAVEPRKPRGHDTSDGVDAVMAWLGQHGQPPLRIGQASELTFPDSHGLQVGIAELRTHHAPPLRIGQASKLTLPDSHGLHAGIAELRTHDNLPPRTIGSDHGERQPIELDTLVGCRHLPCGSSGLHAEKVNWGRSSFSTCRNRISDSRFDSW